MNEMIVISHLHDKGYIEVPSMNRVIHLDLLNQDHLKLVKFLLGLSRDTDLHSALKDKITVNVDAEIARLIVYVFYW